MIEKEGKEDAIKGERKEDGIEGERGGSRVQCIVKCGSLSPSIESIVCVLLHEAFLCTCSLFT